MSEYIHLKYPLLREYIHLKYPSLKDLGVTRNRNSALIFGFHTGPWAFFSAYTNKNKENFWLLKEIVTFVAILTSNARTCVIVGGEVCT